MKLTDLLREDHYQSLDALPSWLATEEDPGSQIRSLRQLYGMTQEQLAQRSQQQARLIRRLETNEGDPRLSTLRKAAEGLNCELVVRFIPKQPVSRMVKQRAEKKARQVIQLSKGSAAIEEQQPAAKYIQHQFDEMVHDLVHKRPSMLWED